MSVIEEVSLARHPNGDSIPTPEWLQPLIDGFFDPYPLNREGPIEPPPGAKVWVNPGFSRKAQAVENAIRWHQEGHYVVCYLPIETSTQIGKRLIQYGVRRLYFERRPYEGCRGIEILVLTGDTDYSPRSGEAKAPMNQTPHSSEEP